MIYVIPALGAALHGREWAGFLDSLAWAGEPWRVLDDAAWDRLRLAFQADAISHALAFAAARQPQPAPWYWGVIQPAVEAVLAALAGEGDLQTTAYALQYW